MKKRHITLFTAIAAAAAFAPAAQAAISATGDIDGWTRTESGTPVNWDVTDRVVGRSNGTLVIDGGSTMTMYNTGVAIGSTIASTMTVTGANSHYDGTAGGSLSIGNNSFGTAGVLGTLNVEDGGWVETFQMQMGDYGNSDVTVTGAGSKLTASNRFQIGRAGTPTAILTVADGGLVRTDLLQFGEGGYTGSGYIHMEAGGIFAVSGDKTGGTSATYFTAGNANSLFTFSGTPTSEIQYDAGAGFVNMTGATEGVDYSVTYETTGDYVGGYTVLTMLDTTTPAADPEITSITSLGGGNFELTLKGDPSTSYEFYSSATLDFTLGGTLVPLTAGGTDVTTDGSGDATVQMSLAGSANFVRAQ